MAYPVWSCFTSISDGFAILIVKTKCFCCTIVPWIGAWATFCFELQWFLSPVEGKKDHDFWIVEWVADYGMQVDYRMSGLRNEKSMAGLRKRPVVERWRAWAAVGGDWR